MSGPTLGAYYGYGSQGNVEAANRIREVSHSVADALLLAADVLGALSAGGVGRQLHPVRQQVDAPQLRAPEQKPDPGPVIPATPSIVAPSAGMPSPVAPSIQQNTGSQGGTANVYHA